MVVTAEPPGRPRRACPCATSATASSASRSSGSSSRSTAPATARAPASGWRSRASWPSAWTGRLSVEALAGPHHLHARAARVTRRAGDRARRRSRWRRRGCGGDGERPGSGGGSDDATSARRARPRPSSARRASRSSSSRASEGGFDARAIYRRDGPGVVTIISVFEGDGGGGILGGGRATRRPAGRPGLGLRRRRGGRDRTNAHVVTQGEGEDIKKADEVYVKFADDNQVPARDRRLRPERRRRAAAS